MELRHLRYFVAVADEGSVSEAARSTLHTAQPSLSRQLRDLEAELGVMLFARETRGMRLTREGQIFLGHARQILRQVDSSVSRLKASSLLLRVGIISGLEAEILPRLRQILKKEADDLEIVVTSRSSVALLQAVHDGNLDFAFVRGATSLRGVRSNSIDRHRIAAFMRADHPLAARDALSIDDIAGHALVAINERVGPALRRTIDIWCEENNVILEPTHSAADIAAAFSLMLVTDTLTLMPEYAERVMPSSLVMRPLLNGPNPLDLSIACRSLSSAAVQSLVNATTRSWLRQGANEA
ncbi:LysR substrate-binding domain-containing protein [uncultured Martelella sp.]|uniref:LysR family transcriptional regulator n=1 Tax=uncultured Martelella sp. TaxID=392331 RepID=UPI0029C64152|nr:LysR substrate-binding domain-containing protein [uncultured Martelella sp.]